MQQSCGAVRRAACSAAKMPSAMPIRQSHSPAATRCSATTAAACGSPPWYRLATARAHRPGRIGVTPAATSSTADSTTSKVRLSRWLRPAPARSARAAGGRVPTPHPPAYPLEPGRRRAGEDLPVLDHGQRPLRTQPMLAAAATTGQSGHQTTIVWSVRSRIAL